jgi:hypothetical protein
MNPTLTDHRLESASWRRRYRTAFSTLAHFRLTVQALALPDDPAPEALSEADLDRFLCRLLSDLHRFAVREIRFFESVAGKPRRWRLGELMPLLDLFDETSGLVSSHLPPQAKQDWRKVAGALVRLKARVVQLHIFG